MKIVKVMPFFAPASAFGGTVTQADTVCARLAARGHQVRVVTSDLGQAADLPRAQWVSRNGYQVYYAPTKRWHNWPPYPPPAMGMPLREALKDADVLTLNVGLTLVNALVRRCAQEAGVPYIYNAEGALCPQRLRIKGMGKWLFLRLYERRILRDAAALHAVTQKEAGDLALQLGSAQHGKPDRIHVIANGVDMGDSSQWPDGKNGGKNGGQGFRQQHGIPPTATVVLFLGRLQKIKGLDLLLEAWAEVARDHEDLHLVIAGPDVDCQARLEQRIAALALGKRVRFVGQVEHATRMAAYRAADVFALTSYSEGLPNAVLEAAAMGLPLWITDRCSVPEVLQFDAGFVGPAEQQPLSQALRAMLKDPDKRQRQGENAQRMARELFAMDAVVTKLENLYRSVAAS